MGAALDLMHKRFGRLFVRARLLERDSRKRVIWLCLCDCGQLTKVATAQLMNGNTRSCGCLSRETVILNGKSNKTHGMTKSPEYKSWCSMKERCYREADPHYHDYGARGIVVCDRWKDSFENFYADMGPRPEGCTLDRKDNDGPYSPDNCRWATTIEQANNKRNNDIHQYQGQGRSLSEISKLTGIPQPTLWSRLNRMGLSIEDAVNWKNYTQVKTKNSQFP